MNSSLNILIEIDQKLREVYKLKQSRETTLKMLEENIDELERVYSNADEGMNALGVQRAMIVGRACRFVKDSLLHGEWINWAREHFTEDCRTLEKYMAISRFKLLSETYAYLGTERVYSITRIAGLIGERSVEALFEEAGLNSDLRSYSSKRFYKAITAILNKKELEERDICLSAEEIKKLTENFMLLKDKPTVLSRLEEAKSEEANMGKVVQNIVAIHAPRRPQKKARSSKEKDYNVNVAAEIFIRSMGAALQNSDSLLSVPKERIDFILKLIGEYNQLLENNN